MYPQEDRISISYSDDEVTKFHPLVEKSINEFLKQNRLGGYYEVRHHPTDSVGTIPDFVIVDKASGAWVFVIEVKRTPNSVKSIRSWNQSRSYVSNNRSTRWGSGKKPYFLVTNLEQTYILCDRNNVSTPYCLLRGGEISLPLFGDDATRTIQAFYTSVVPRIFQLIQNQVAEFAKNLEQILESFSNLQEQLSKHIETKLLPEIRKNPIEFGFTDANSFTTTLNQWWENITPRNEMLDVRKIARYIARDGLLRILTYEYCREHFSQLAIHTGLHSMRGAHRDTLAESIGLSLEDLGNIDFTQIISSRLLKYIPENFDDTTFTIIHNFLEIVHQNVSNAIRENGSISYLLSLISLDNNLYPWEEVNGDGKVMTDPELADFVAWISVNLLENSNLPLILEPGVGTGNILSSLYDTLRNKFPHLSHNRLLAQFHGYESDFFLGKLAVLNMTMKSPIEVDVDTKVDVNISNFFNLGTEEFGKYNLVVMNPPFLRNDNKVSDLRRDYLEQRIEDVTSKPSYMKDSSQPNYSFYFIELASWVLKNQGTLCSFVSNSTLSTKSGSILRDFLLSNFELKYVIVPPRIFFQDYKVTPCIIVGTRNASQEGENMVKFVRISEPDFFTIDYNIFLNSPLELKGKLHYKEVKQSSLRFEDDWRKFLLPVPSYYELFKKSHLFISLDELFCEIKRGGLASEGDGRDFFFPWSSKAVKDKIGSELESIESRFAQLGLDNAKDASGYSLSITDLEKQKVLAYPRDAELGDFPGLMEFIEKFTSKFKIPRRPHAEDFPSSAQLVIPRAVRKVHRVHFNPFWAEKEVYFSSNFICLMGLKGGIEGFDVNEVLHYIVAFLNSSFGQLIFEIESIDREGLRKMEEFNLSNVSIPWESIERGEGLVKEIVEEFKNLQYGLIGIENYPSPRSRLDHAISKLLWKYDKTFRFSATSPEDLVKKVELDLRSIVRIRREESTKL